MADQELSVEELAANEQFQQWVLHPTPESKAYWSEWAEEHPEYKAKLSQARQLLLNLHLEGNTAPDYLQQEVWGKIKPTLRKDNRAVLGNWRVSRAVRVAASLAIIVGVSIIFLIYSSATTTYRTAYGETQEITLPDGSSVTLNANSSIQFAPDWERAEVREVWLAGEAFFDVRQILLSEDSNVRMPFIVHSQNMDVEVLGTAFNVKDRQEYSEVVLNSGKVNVTPRLEKQTAPIAMDPGDRLAYSTSQREWKIQQVDPKIPTAWRNQELIFDEMPLIEIARLLEDVYGYEISFATKEIEAYAFTGNIRSDEIEMLLPMLERSFGLRVQQDGQQINFSKR